MNLHKPAAETIQIELVPELKLLRQQHSATEEDSENFHAVRMPLGQIVAKPKFVAVSRQPVPAACSEANDSWVQAEAPQQIR